MGIRLARLEDARLLWEWSQDPAVQSTAFDPTPVSWEAHRVWMAQRLQDGRSLLTLLEAGDGTPIGQLRFDVVPEGREIDFSIAAPFRGQGYGKTLLQDAMRLARERWPGSTVVIARILAGNAPSLALCQRVGFRITEYGHDAGKSYVRLERRLAEGN